MVVSKVCARVFFHQHFALASQLTHGIGVFLLRRTRCSHRVRLAGTRLTVSEDRDIVSLSEGVDALFEVLPHAGLVNLGAKYAVKDEQLAALGRIDRQAGRRLHVGHGPLEALWYEFVARVGGLQRRADADGYKAKRQNAAVHEEA